VIKPRSKRGIRFPFIFESNGRTGRIKKWGEGKFGTYFLFAGKKCRNSFGSFETAYEFLDREFSKLDTDRANALSLNPLNQNVQAYAELEELLRREGDGATLRDAVAFFLAHHRHKRFEAKTFSECSTMFVKHQEGNNISPIQIKTLEKHFRRFEQDFGTRKIHEITTMEISDWLISQANKGTTIPWSAKTRISNLGSLVSLSLFARDVLQAIPDFGKTEFQKVRRPKNDEREEVEIFTPVQMETLLLTALNTDIDLIPALVTGGFQGLRPAEFHAEGTRRRPLPWEAFIWNDKILHVTGQKVRSKANRDIPLHPVTELWLAPFKHLTGEIWKHTSAHSKKMIGLWTDAKVESIYDGFRHSYASYRIRQLKGNLPELAQEMGNSPREIINSYKRNVTDAEAAKWFNITPPIDYAETVKAFLELR
jgi:hypothetical protein